MDYIKKSTILAYVAQFLPDNPIILEAGAFDGTDTKKWLLFGLTQQFTPLNQCLLFFEKLTQATQDYPQVHRYPYALADHNGTATFHVSEKPSKPGEPFQAGTLIKPKERLKHSPIAYPTTITIPTMTLDSWAEQEEITQIDFMWLDVQGAALPILQHGTKTLEKVQALFIEVEFIEAYENQAQYPEVDTWLKTQGFIPQAKDFTDNPTWIYGNVLYLKNKC